MTKIFIDANVLVAVLNKEYPLFRTAARILSLADYPPFVLYTSATCLAIACYFAEKKSGRKAAREKMALLASKIQITPCGPDEVQAALADAKVKDFEDGLQHYAALHAGCGAIITENQEDFYFSRIRVMDCESYLREIALPLFVKGKKP